jgi:uncharacterized membrane protein
MEFPGDAAAGEDVEETTADGRTSAFLAIALPDPLLAQEALMATVRLQARDRLKLEDAAIVGKDDDGKVRVQETRDITTTQGAMAGSWWGLIGGLLAGGPLVGVALGAALGGIFAKVRDIGIKDEEIQALGEEIRPGEAALLLLVEDGHLVHGLAEMRRFHGRLLRTTCPDDTAERMREALSSDPWSWG